MNIPLVDLKAQYISIKPEIDAAIQEIIGNTSFIMGKPVKEFEENLAKFCNCPYAIGTNSGTSALFLALKAYGIKEGDEVITVPNTFIATVEAIIHCGAKPIFVDIDEKTMLIDVNKIEPAITKKTRAILPVHLYGQICDMDPIIELAKKYNLLIIEDAAQAIDAEYKGRTLPLSETAIFSFFPAKNLGCYGDGGAVITKNEEIAQKVAKLRDHGRISKYESDLVGFGERLDALQAAILKVKLKYLKEWSGKRRKNAYHYNEQLKETITIPFEEEYSKHVYYMYEAKTKDRDRIMEKLQERGIACGIHFPLPLHLQPALSFLGYQEGDFPVTEKAAKEIISLPMFPELSEKQIQYIVKNLKEIREEAKMNNTYTEENLINKNAEDKLFSKKTILVTGGAGFIGSHLIERCLELNARKVISFDNLCGFGNDNLAHLRSDPRLVEVVGNIQDYDQIKPYVEEADVIFNNAASKLIVSLKDPAIDVQTNVNGNFNILEIMRKCSSKARLIHASTGSVFGSHETPFTEKSAMFPSTVYGISKLAAEKYMLLYAKEYGLKISVLRYFHVFGPRQDYSGGAGVINIFLSQVLNGKAPTVCLPGEQTRCFTFVKDVVNANLLLYKDYSTIGKSYNVASKTRMRVDELAKIIIQRYGPEGMQPEFITPRMGENLKPIPDTSDIEALGFRETISFEEGLDRTKEWVCQNLKDKGLLN